MSITEAKRNILEVLSETEKPMKLQDIAEKTGLNVKSSMMHLLRLRKMGYVSMPERNLYLITPHGKQALSLPKQVVSLPKQPVRLPKTDKKQAEDILRLVPIDKAFHFHTGINQYSGIYATSLSDFCNKIKTINVKSIEFHVLRKDFESWIASLGDSELVKKIEAIRATGLLGENLRQRVYTTTKSRFDELSQIVSKV
jgi:predicted transcriptional regulator